MNTNLNIDAKTLEMCLKSISNIGSTTYKNICDGSMNTVVWGSADWIGAFGLGLFVLFGLCFLIGMVKMIISI